MTLNRSLHITLLAILVTLVAVIAHPLIPEKELSLLPNPDVPVIYAPYGDAEVGGPTHSEWLGPEEDRIWRCRVERGADFHFCGLNLIVATESQRGMDLTGYHTVELKVTPGSDQRRIEFFMRHFDERYSVPEDSNSAQFNKFDFLPGELDGSVRLHFDELTLADWWSSSRDLPRNLRRPAFHNVVALGFGFVDITEPGHYTLELERVSLVGDWVSAEAWYLSILLSWLFGLGTWVLYRLRSLAVRERRQRRSLDKLSSRNAELKQESEHYRKLSTRDPLTGAYNRFGFEQRLADTVHREELQPISLVLMDVDYFKSFNDNYGHDAGDRVLKRLIELVQQHTRKHDVICRWGGEEFLLLCPSTDSRNAKELAEKLRRLISERTLDADIDEHLTASFGVCEIGVGEPYDDAFVRADRALYQAKEQGRDRVVACHES